MPAAGRSASANATSIAGTAAFWSPALNTTYCLPRCRYVIGSPVCTPGMRVSQSTSPVRLSSARKYGSPPHPSPAKSSVFVTSSPAFETLPVRPTSTPVSFGWFLISRGVPPFGICHACSPRFMSIAVMRP